MPTLEQRLAELEEKVASLLRERQETAQELWWERIRGTFKDDPMYDEAMRLGREWREAQPFAEGEKEA